MKSRPFHWELRDVIGSFCAALDDVVICRYNTDRSPANTVKVRYVYASKERVLYDLENKAQNIELPVISVCVNSIARDDSRIFNKILGVNYPNMNGGYGGTVNVRQPVPINIEVNVSIVTKFQLDMDQILSNFIPYNNPYIILSWFVPKEFNLAYEYEIRSEVHWAGSISLKYPIEVTASDKTRFVADTMFTIKGWLFPEVRDPNGIIYYIQENLHVSRFDSFIYGLSSSSQNATLTAALYNSVGDLSFTYPASAFLVNDTETVSLTGTISEQLDTEDPIPIITEDGVELYTNVTDEGSIQSSIY